MTNRNLGYRVLVITLLLILGTLKIISYATWEKFGDTEGTMVWIIIVAIMVGVAVYLFFRQTKADRIEAREEAITPIFRDILPEQYVIVDVETTGLDPEEHEIIEIGAIKINRDSTEHDTFRFLVRPQQEVPKEITEITGITQKMLETEGHGDVLTAMGEFLDFVGNLRLVAYNAPFDLAFLTKAAGLIGRTIDNPISCAFDMAKRAWPGRKSYKLTSLR